MASPNTPLPPQGESRLPQILENFDQRLNNLEQNQNATSSSSLSPDKSDQITSHPDPKPARVCFNNKEYIINVKLAGKDNNNPSPAQSQKFATLYGITLQYGLAALMYQHNLKEEDINLKYVKIKKKTNDNIYLIYANPKKEYRYKLKIDNHLDITKTEDKEKITQDAPDQKSLDTAYKTHQAAISCLKDQTTDIGDAENTPIGKYTIAIFSKEFLSQNVKTYYDPNSKENKFYPKPLKSKASKNAATTAINENNDHSKSVEKSDKTGTSLPFSNSEAAAETNSTVIQKDPKMELKALVKKDALEETENLSKEESESKAENIPSYTRDDDAQENRHSWIEYLLNGILTSPASGTNYHLRNNLVEREVNPLIFNKEKVKEILFNIFSLNIINLDKKDKIFLKRLLLIIIAEAKDREKDPKSETFDLKTELKNIFDKFVKIDLINKDEKSQLEANLKENQNQVLDLFDTQYRTMREKLGISVISGTWTKR